MAFYQSLAYEASAGSGKTFALVIRYISLLYLGAKPNTILSLTFTNKAANEMQVRIATVLKELHLPKRQAELSEISRSVALSEEEVLEKREEIYHDYLQSDLKISTLDKFFSQVVRLFAMHLGIMPDFTIDERKEEQKFIVRFLQNIRQKDRYKDLVLFSAKEKKRLSDIFSFLDYLYTKDAELLHFNFSSNTPPPKESEILAQVGALKMLFDDHCPTLSNRAKKTLEVDKVETLLGKSWICKESFEYWDYKKCYLPAMDEILREIQTKTARFLEERDRFLLQKYFTLYHIYKKSIRQENIATNTLGFNDVTNALFELLHQNIQSDFLYFRLDATIEHLLIDEFQDTNIVQYKILEPIIEEIHAGIGTKEFKSFFYVGDIKQSIYRFRGGAKELFHHLQRQFGVTLKQLNTNYRSRCNLVKFVNETFDGIIKGYHPQECAKKEDRGYVKVAFHDDLLENITTQTLTLLQKGIPAEDIAILTYTNADAFNIEEALLQKDPTLKITTQTSAKLINTQYVSAVIEFLKYLYFKEEICKINFLSLIGKSWESEVVLENFSIYQELSKLIKQIISTFLLPGEDANLLKLIEIASGYKDIEAFLFEVEELPIEAPSKKSEGIKILTVHKSKGLEFTHIILADRFKKKSPDRSTLIFYYDDIKLQEIYVRTSKRDCVDKAYQKALLREKELSFEDELNVLYVAFTRAKESLIICHNKEESAFAPLALKEIEYGKLSIPPKQQSTIIDQPTLHFQPIRLGLQEQKLKKEKSEEENLTSIHFGNALHYMLELLTEFCVDEIENAYWAMRNRYELFLQEGDAQKIKARVEKLLTYQPFLDLIEGEITKEQPITYQGELKQLDLLVQKEDRFIIIDYKSSPIERSEHKSQVRHYKKAITAITKQKVEGYLCYVREEEIVLVGVN